MTSVHTVAPPPINGQKEEVRIARLITASLTRLHRRGVVLGVSGGIDSAVCLTLAARALGSRRVLALLMPERDTPADSMERAVALCASLGVRYRVENITHSLTACGCYSRRDGAIQRIFPDYDEDWRQKIVLASPPTGQMPLGLFDLVVEDPTGESWRARMPVAVYRQVVAATNMKQRVRKMVEYFHAENENFAVLGTPNRLEYQLGFFVRGGDGLADLKPITHLYKGQVYALAAHLGVPEQIRRQPPSTETYSLNQTQDEFYFGLPWPTVDALLWAQNAGLTAEQAGLGTGLTPEQVALVWRDFSGKQRVAARSLGEADMVEPVATAPALSAGSYTSKARRRAQTAMLSPRISASEPWRGSF